MQKVKWHIQLLRGRFFEQNKSFSEVLDHTRNYITASVLTKIVSIISIPILTYSLSVEDYGIYSIFLSLISLLGIFCGFGIRGALTRYFYEDQNDLDEFVFSGLGLITIFNIIFFFVLFLGLDSFSILVNVPKPVIIMAAMVSCFIAYEQLYSNYLQAAKESKKVAYINVTRSVGVFVLLLGFVYVFDAHNYYAPIVSHIVISALLCAVSVGALVKLLKPRVKVEHIKYILPISLPIMFHFLAGYVLNTFDQIMVNKMIGTYEAGLYAFMYRIGLIYQIITISMNQAWAPIFFGHLKNKEYSLIQNTAGKYTIVVSALALLLVIFSPLLVRVIAPTEYLIALPLLPILLIGFLFQYLYTLYSNYSFYQKNMYSMAVITMFVGSVNIVLNYVFIAMYGYQAAAWTTMFTYGLFFLLHYLNVKKRFEGEILNLRPLVNILLFTILLMFTSYISITFIGDTIINIAIACVQLVLFVICLGKKYRAFSGRMNVSDGIK